MMGGGHFAAAVFEKYVWNEIYRKYLEISHSLAELLLTLSWETSKEGQGWTWTFSIKIGTGGDLKPKISLGEVVSVILFGLDYKLMQLLT